MAEPIKLTVEQVRNRAAEQSYARGESYYRSGAIFDTVRRGNTLEGYCEGSQPTPYRVQVTLGEEGVVGAWCTCPYDWGGDCKHIVALLLTYVHKPEVFEERPPLDEALAQRSREELVELIRLMVARYPDLETLIDRPAPTGHPRSTPVNTESFRRELRYAMRGYDGWGDYDALATVRSVADTAARFAAQGDWRSASAIYSAILDECLEDADMFDDEGDFIGALSEVVEALIGVLEAASTAGDDAEREALLDTLMGAYIWDVDFGGVGLSDGVPEAILAHATRADLPRIRAQVQAALKQKQASEYGHWGAEAYTRFLIELDALDNVDPEVTLRRLREEGFYDLLFEKLLQMGRTEEAIKVAAEHLTHPHARLQAAMLLSDAGYTDVAIRLAEDQLRAGYDQYLAEWLIEQHEARSDWEACLRLQRQRVGAAPYFAVEYYAALKEVAEALGRWGDVRAEVIGWMEGQRRYEPLTRIYLYERNWDAAWDALEKVPRPARLGWADWEVQHLEMDVARETRFERPHKAIPVYVKYARAQIGRRSRKNYAAAANALATVCEVYRHLNDEASWKDLISSIRIEFKSLPALQDELNKAGL